MTQKGPNFEEIVRAFFDWQGSFALRGISYRHENEQVTDIDVWLYSRQSASARIRTIVDVKNKRSPKAFERILWVRGMQQALGCDRAVVATTERNAKISKFAHQQKVTLLTKEFLNRLQNKLDITNRLTLEQFLGNIQRYKEHKQDGDWLRRISDAKSALISLQGYPAFNKAIAEFSFFAERVETRPHHREQALRGAYLTAALACIALDSALERVVYDDQISRYQAIADGVTYGDAGDASVQRSIETVLDVITEGMENGRVISRQAQDALNKMFEKVRADIIAEHFTKERNASVLVPVAKELDDRAHRINPIEIQTLSPEAKSILGLYADFVQAKRGMLLNGGLSEGVREVQAKRDTEASEAKGESKRIPDSNQKSLL